MVKRTFMLATAMLLLVTVGCTTGSKWMAGGTLVGAATGACIGGVWANATAGDLTAAEGALVGAAAGGLTGAIVGEVIGASKDKAEFDRLNAEIARLTSENEQLKRDLARCREELANANKRIQDLEAELAKLRGGRVPAFEISLGADVLFRSGSATLSAKGKQALEAAAQRVKGEGAGKFVMVEGHTDAQPIQRSHWKSNWELGAARALTVLHYLTDKGVDPAMLSAATFSKYQPVASNDTKEGRSENRRAVIVVYNNWPRGGAK